MVVGQVGGAEIRIEAIVGVGIKREHMRGRAEAAVVAADQPLQRSLTGRGQPQLLAELTRVVILGDRSGAEPEKCAATLRYRCVDEKGHAAGGPKNPPM